MGTTLPSEDSPGIITMAVSDPSKIGYSLTAGINQWIKFDENPSQYVNLQGFDLNFQFIEGCYLNEAPPDTVNLEVPIYDPA